VADPESQIAMIYQEIARNVGARIAQGGMQQAMPSIVISED
jgi:ATP-binding protein involved in chromosome partitioning